MQDDRDQLFFDFYDDSCHAEENRGSSRPGVSKVIDKLNFNTEEDALEVLTGKKSIKEVIEEDTDSWIPCDAGNPEDMTAKAWLENQGASAALSESSSNAVPEKEGDGSPLSSVLCSALPEAGENAPLNDNHGSLDSAESSAVSEKERNEGSAESGEQNETVSSDAVPMAAAPVVQRGKRAKCVAMSLPLLRRAALGFLGSMKPSCAAMRVPAAVSRIKADAAAFWIPAKCHVNVAPVRSALVLTYLSCPDFSCDEKIRGAYFSALQKLEQEKTELESHIRQNEPYT